MKAAVTAAVLMLAAQSAAQHDMPPPVNIVGAGFNLEYAASQQRTAAITRLIGGVATGVLFALPNTRGTAAPWVVGGWTIGVSFALDLSSARWTDRAGDLWQCGYSPDALWEQVPDSVGDLRPKPLRLPALINGTPIHAPARMW